MLLKFWLLTGLSTIIGMVLYYILLACGVDHSIAYFCQYSVAVVILFLMKFVLSEGVSKRSIIPRAIVFFTLYAITMFIGERLLVLFTERWGIPAWLSLWLTYPVTFTLNTLGSRYIVFRDADNNEIQAIKDLKAERDADGGKDCNGGEESITENDSDE